MKSINLLLIFTILFTYCNAAPTKKVDKQNNDVSVHSDLGDGMYASIKTNKGEIVLKLHYEKVPLTVANFVALSEGNHPKVKKSLQGKPFYKGIKFHRVINNFMIQGGDPTGTGMGDAGYSFDDEFPLNDDGSLIYKHDKAGVLSMANSGPATNSCQFFITHKDTPWLDGKHTIFGEVVKGKKVVNLIVQNDVINELKIVRIGKKAKKFDAPKVFSDEESKSAEKKVAREKKLAKAEEAFKKKMGFDKSKKTESGLRFLQLKKGKGKKVNAMLPTQVHYTLYNAAGKKIDSSVDRKLPFTFTLAKDGLIAGWKEGAAMMKEGEKARLFIPSYLGYGKVGRPPVIPANTDLIFEIEILKVGK